jgi:hypothetical protein
MIINKGILLLLLTLTSCISATGIVDYDDLYYNSNQRRLNVTTGYYWDDNLSIRPNYFWNNNLYPGFNPYLYNQPRTIIIVPQKENNVTYGKRPTREGNINPNNKSYSLRGRK